MLCDVEILPSPRKTVIAFDDNFKYIPQISKFFLNNLVSCTDLKVANGFNSNI